MFRRTLQEPRGGSIPLYLLDMATKKSWILNLGLQLLSAHFYLQVCLLQTTTNVIMIWIVFQFKWKLDCKYDQSRVNHVIVISIAVKIKSIWYMKHWCHNYFLPQIFQILLTSGYGHNVKMTCHKNEDIHKSWFCHVFTIKYPESKWCTEMVTIHWSKYIEKTRKSLQMWK